MWCWRISGPDDLKTNEKRTTIMMRSHYCGQLNESLDGQEITLCGWVHRRRDHGGVIFLDIRDREGGSGGVRPGSRRDFRQG